MNASLPAILGFPHAAPPAPARTIEVVTGVHWLRMPLPFALDHINLWLLADGAGWTQIDCGYGDAATRSLWDTHFTRTLAGRPLSRVVATHYHPDHLGNAAWLAQRFGCTLFMAQAEFMTAHMVAGGHACYGNESICDLFRDHGMADEHLAAMRARGNNYKRGVPELPAGFRRIIPGDGVDIDGKRWRTIGGYGHSPEHIALYCQELAVCISGDMLLPRISTNVSVGPAERDGNPLGRFLTSLEAFRALPPDTLVLPSHGLPFVGAALRVAQLEAHHVARLAELEAAVDAPRSAAELLPVLFRRELDLQQRYFAMGETIAHLNYLWHAGRLARNIAADGSVRFGRTH
jgi:glyoxylase-like metal-dependent hydrolase (beta-lactamase superfamily II)